MRPSTGTEKIVSVAVSWRTRWMWRIIASSGETSRRIPLSNLFASETVRSMRVPKAGTSLECTTLPSATTYQTATLIGSGLAARSWFEKPSTVVNRVSCRTSGE